MTSARTFSIAVFVSLLALSACGSSAKKVDPAADLALAKRAVLTKADMAGYTAKPHTKSDDPPDKAAKDFAACIGAPTSIFDDVPGAQQADSPNFSKGHARVSNSVEIDPKKSDIDKSWKQISKEGVAPCLRKLLEVEVKDALRDTPGVSLGATSIERFDVGVGDRSVGYALTFPATARGITLTVYEDLVFVPRDRAVLEFAFSDVNTPPDRTVEALLVQKVYDRIGNKAK